jgi:type I restriction enzyme S subunit
MSFSADINQVVEENRNQLLGKHPLWGRVRLREVATILNGFPFQSERFHKGRGTPLIRIRDILPGQTETFYEGEYDSSFIVARGEILIGMDGDFHCKPWAGDPALLNQRVCKITPDESRYSKRFLNYVLPGYLNAIHAHTSSVTVKHLSSRTIADIPLPLPPLPEQRRIVAEIEKQFTRLEAGVAALKRVQANLKRYRAAVLKAACEGRLVETEGNWPQKQIAAVVKTMDQGWSPKCESDPSDNDATWAVIRTTAIQNLHFVEGENKTLPVMLKPRPHMEILAGDLLVTRAGPRNRVGVACLVKKTRPRLMLCDKAYRLRCKMDVVNPAFLELVLNAPHVVDAVNELKTGISDSGVNLTQKRFGELLIPVPSIAEQTQIVAEVERRLSVIEGMEAVVVANLKRATRLRQSILQKAFSGELTS